MNERKVKVRGLNFYYRLSKGFSAIKIWKCIKKTTFYPPDLFHTFVLKCNFHFFCLFVYFFHKKEYLCVAALFEIAIAV